MSKNAIIPLLITHCPIPYYYITHYHIYIMSERVLKLNQLIKNQLGQIIIREIELPNECLVTITRVEITPDIKVAKIFISVLPENFRGTALAILRKNNKTLYTQLKKQVKTKFTPNLQFLIDDQQAYATEIDKLLDEIS